MNEKNNDNNVLVYELGYHLLPTVDENDVLVESSKIKSLIEDNSGEIVSEGLPKTMPLAYDISKEINAKSLKFNKAYFGWIKFEIDSTAIASIKEKLENNKNILRFLIVKTVKENTMHTPKIPNFFKKESRKEESTGGEIEVPKATEEEIDKSIDELISEETL